MKYEPLTSEQYYHIYNCGNNGEDIFIEEQNYPYFLELLKKYIVPVAHILSYCLFQRKFQRKRIDSEDYLRKLVVYINLNPVIHGFCKNYKDYKHSSYKALVSDRPTSLDRAFVIDLFDDRENFKYSLDLRKYIIDDEDYYLE